MLTDFHSTDTRKWWQELLIAGLLLLPGYWFGNEYMVLPLPFLLLWLDRKEIREVFLHNWKTLRKSDKWRYVVIPAVFLLLATLNKLINGQTISCLKDWYAAFMLLPLMLLVAWRGISNRTMQLLLLAVLLEVVVAVIEYVCNVRSLFVPPAKELIIESKASLYDSRVYGFGANSPIFALRCFIALFFLQGLNWNRWIKVVILGILMTGILLSFNRSVIVALWVFLPLSVAQVLWARRRLWKEWYRLREVQDTLLVLSLTILVFSNGFVWNSFMRGGKQEQLEVPIGEIDWSHYTLTCQQAHAFPMKNASEVDTTGYYSRMLLEKTRGLNSSGRKLIWLNYTAFLSENKLFGNGSDKLMLRTINPKSREVELMHAHNSFLMVFSTHGVIIGLLFLLMYLFWWKWRNVPFVLAILVYSLLQYGLFWGFSYLDVVLVAALLMPFNLFERGYKGTPEKS